MKIKTPILCASLLTAWVATALADTFTLNSRGSGSGYNVQTTWISSNTNDTPTGSGGNHRLNDWGVVDKPYSGTENRFLLQFDLSAIKAAAGTRTIAVNYAIVTINRDWTASNGWTSQSLYTATTFTPATTTWNNGSGLQENYIGDIGGGGAASMAWDSRYPGTNSWDIHIADLKPDVQGDLDNNRESDYMLRINSGNEWSAQAGIGAVSLVVDVTFTDPLDTDADGLPDAWEISHFGNLGETPGGDFDNDGSTNLAEYTAGSDPTMASSTPLDTDGDGLPDAWERQYFGNLGENGSGDSDHDGSTNAEEYAGNSDPTNAASQPDSDADGLPDGWEYLHFGSLAETAAGDYDNDGYTNLAEYLAGSNPSLAASTPIDINGNGVIDSWEGTWLAHGNQYGEAYNINPITGLIPGGTVVKASHFGDGSRAVTVAGISFDTDYSNTNYASLWHPDDAPVRFDEDSNPAVETDAENLMNHRVNVYSWGGNPLTIALPHLVIGRTYRFQVITSNPDGSGYGADFYHTVAGSATVLDYVYSWMGGIATTGSHLRVYEWTATDSSVIFCLGVNGNNYDNHDVIAYAVTDISADSDGDGLADKWEMLHFNNLNQNATSDFDHDGWSDLAEHLANTDPKNANSTPYDTDNDGLADAWEIAKFGNLSQDGAGDADGDGASNLLEFALDSNPSLASSLPTTHLVMADTNAIPGKELLLVAAVRGGAVFAADGASQMASVNGITYHVQGSMGLAGFDAPVETLALPLAPALLDGLPALDSGWEYRAFRLTGSDGLAGKGFLRMRVSH